MPDYLVTKSFHLDVMAAPSPPGPAIQALRAEIQQLENAQPKPQSVPAFELKTMVPATPQRPQPAH